LAFKPLSAFKNEHPSLDNLYARSILGVREITDRDEGCKRSGANPALRLLQGEPETPRGDEEMSGKNVKCEDLTPISETAQKIGRPAEVLKETKVRLFAA
jgi:hypothetical protein